MRWDLSVEDNTEENKKGPIKVAALVASAVIKKQRLFEVLWAPRTGDKSPVDSWGAKFLTPGEPYTLHDTPAQALQPSIDYGSAIGPSRNRDFIAKLHHNAVWSHQTLLAYRAQKERHGVTLLDESTLHSTQILHRGTNIPMHQIHVVEKDGQTAADMCRANLPPDLPRGFSIHPCSLSVYLQSPVVHPSCSFFLDFWGILGAETQRDIDMLLSKGWLCCEPFGILGITVSTRGYPGSKKHPPPRVVDYVVACGRKNNLSVRLLYKESWWPNMQFCLFKIYRTSASG